MSVRLPVYTHISVTGYQMYPGTPDEPGIVHEFVPGLHLVAGVNGLGKSTLLLILYHSLAGPAAIRNDDLGVPMPDIVARRDVDRFRKRVADAGREALATVGFKIGALSFEVTRSLHDLSLQSWKINGADQVLDSTTYMETLSEAMNVGSFADVLTILNLIVFMFEDRELLMWAPMVQRNALRALFMTPAEANELAERAQVVATANSAYRNLLYIANRDRKQLDTAKEQLAAADALSAEYHTLQRGIAALNERHSELRERREDIEQLWTEARSTTEAAKFNYDDIVREMEALKLARVAREFPSSNQSSQYVLARLIGDKECLACGADDGPLIEKWIAAVADGSCVLCGTVEENQETVIPPVLVDTARLSKLDERLHKARQSLDAAIADEATQERARSDLQAELDRIVQERSPLEKRARQIAGFVPPSPPEVAALEERVKTQFDILAQMKLDQSDAERAFSEIFGQFKSSVEKRADAIRQRFSEKIAEFLVEKAEITLAVRRGPIGESGQSYDWPTFNLSMTSGTFGAPAPRLSRKDVSMSQGEFIDLAFRLALVGVAAEDGPATMIFDAPEASLDALFMRRAGAFLARFTEANLENRLIVTSNLTNAAMIPALFGAYEPEEGDPTPHTIPRGDRRKRVIDLLELAAPTSAVELVGNRYKNLLDQAIFPPEGQAVAGL